MNGEDQQRPYSQDARFGSAMRISGIFLIVVSIMWWLIIRFVETNANILILNWHLPALLIGLFLNYRGKQYLARSQPAEILNDKRPPVIYLRLFKKDATTVARVLPGIMNPAMLLQSFNTFEEQLVEVVKKIGPVLALAQPDKSLPKPGAARFHPMDQEWETLVSDLMSKAGLVIIRPGISEALKWEIGKAFELVPPNRILFLFYETNKRDYIAISAFLKQSYGISLPDISEAKPFIIGFKDDWEVYLLPKKVPFFRRGMPNPIKRLINHALEPVFNDLDVEWKPSPVSPMTVFSFIIVPILFLLFIIAISLD